MDIIKTMKALSGYVFTGTYLKLLTEIGLNPIDSSWVFAESALLHTYSFNSESGDSFHLQIYEVHDELEFLRLSGRKEFLVNFEEVNRLGDRSQLSAQNPYSSVGPLGRTDSIETELKLYFEIRKKSSPYAWILRIPSNQDSVLRKFALLEESKKVMRLPRDRTRSWLLSLGPDCFDFIFLTED